MWARIKTALAKFFHRRRLIRYGVYLCLLLLIFLFRVPILRGFGHWLIHEDKLEKADAIVQLGGNAYERSIKAAELYKKGYAPRLVTTGSNESVALQALNLHYTEAQNSKEGLKQRGVPDSVIFALDKGTSTLEEAEALRQYASTQHFKKIILVTAKFHTARVHKYFNRAFKNSGIQLIVQGASPVDYDTENWWHSEDGLLMVNNEYVKSFYYWWKY